jgi:hypothetical protein
MSNYSQLIHTPYFRHTLLTTLPIDPFIGIVTAVYKHYDADKLLTDELFSAIQAMPIIRRPDRYR